MNEICFVDLILIGLVAVSGIWAVLSYCWIGMMKKNQGVAWVVQVITLGASLYLCLPLFLEGCQGKSWGEILFEGAFICALSGLISFLGCMIGISASGNIDDDDNGFNSQKLSAIAP